MISGTPPGPTQNSPGYMADKPIRKCKRINSYVVNPKYPWLFASLDSLINKKGGFNLLTGQPLEEEAILECKTLTFNSAKMWESGFPLYHIFQVQTYMIVMEVDYAEVAVLQDGNKFEVIPIEKDQEMCDRILNETSDFWFNKVMPAKQACKEIMKLHEAARDIEADVQEALIQQVEPEPDNTEDYQQFLSEIYTREYSCVDGPQSLFRMCKKDELAKEIIKALTNRRLNFRNHLVKYIIAEKTEMVDFGKLGNIKYFLKSGDQKHTMRVNLKIKPEPEVVNEMIRKLGI